MNYMTDFVSDILSEDNLDKKEMISQILNISWKRLQLQYHYPTVKVLVTNDYVAHIIGEMNGFFQCLKVLGIIKCTILATISGGIMIYKDTQSKESLLELAL